MLISLRNTRYCYLDRFLFHDEFALIICSQTKFVAIILVLSGFFYGIFRLTDFASDAFDFSSSKQDKQVAPSGH